MPKLKEAWAKGYGVKLIAELTAFKLVHTTRRDRTRTESILYDNRKNLLEFLDYEIKLLESSGNNTDAVATLRAVQQYYEKQLDLRNSGDYEEIFREPRLNSWHNTIRII